MPANKTMRITGGSLVRRRFLIPTEVDDNLVRPTPDRVREALFSMLKADMQGASVLDVFAGSGAHGFEALSRGARKVRFIEKNPHIAKTIKASSELLGIAALCELTQTDAVKFIAQAAGEKFDIIFVDPPYLLKLPESFFADLAPHLSDDGLVIFRCHKNDLPQLSKDWQIIRERVYGGTKIFIIEKSENKRVHL